MSASSQLIEGHHRKEMPTALVLTEAKSNPPSPRELATMTNVNVLDLHKDYGDSTTKVFDKDTNTVYVYSNHKSINNSDVVETIVESGQALPPQLSVGHANIIQRTDHPHEIRDAHRPNIIPTSEEITRIVDNNFIQRLVENQEVISKEYINGETRIITRNENGEHILTRIVGSDHKNINAVNNLFTHNGEPLVHFDKNENKHHTVYASDANKTEPLKQVIYTHGDKEILFTTAEGKSTEIYSAVNGDEKQHVDLIYEDGNKTVIYTTAGDQKGLEIYQSGEVSMIGENQVIIQGGLQYTPQPGPNGTTVYVLAEMPADEVNGIPRYVHNFIYILIHFIHALEADTYK